MPINANTPYVNCYVRMEVTGLDHDLEGYIFGVKSIINYPLLFHFQGSNGAVFWNLPINSFFHGGEYDPISSSEKVRLSLLQTWDCQSNSISVTCFKFLQNKRVDVNCRDRVWRSGIYLFTIDDYAGDANEVPVGHSEAMDSKCFHFIMLDCGNFCVQPNNLLRWHNADFIVPYPKDDPPKIRLKNDFISSEDVDRTYGNSAYYFYGE
jgi:hypothetical protein